MVNGSRKTFEDQIKVAFQSGYTNAATSFSMMANGKFSFHNFHYSLHKINGQIIPELGTANLHTPTRMVTTELFGEVSGKSYLFFSQHDFDLLTQGIKHQENSGINLKEEYIKELDNILSAAVITKLSNELKVKMYGDIPILTKVSDTIDTIIHQDFNEQADEIYISSTSFSSANHAGISPLFIWVVDCKILDAMESKSTIMK